MAMIDLTGQQLPSGTLRSDELLLERFTREAQNLGKQAQPTSDMARHLAQSAEQVGRMSREITGLTSAIDSLSQSLRQAFREAIEGVRGGPTGQGARIQVAPSASNIAPSIIASVVTASALSGGVVNQIINQSAQHVTRIYGGAPRVSPAGREARQGKNLLEVINTGSAQEIAALGLPHLGGDPAGSNIAKLLAAREARMAGGKGPYTDPMQVGESVKGIGTGVKGQQLAQALTGQDVAGTPEQTTKPLSRMQQIRQASIEQNKSLAEQIKMEEARAKYAGNRQGIERLNKEVQLQNDLVRATRSADWKEQIAIQGLWGARLSYFREQAQGLAEGMEKFGSSAGRAFGVATAGILGLVSVGDPVAFQTFRRSIEWLSFSIGSQFGDSVLQASAWIQRLANSIDNMDEGTKKSIARWVTYSVVLTGVSFALAKVGGALLLVSRAAMTTTAFLAANPLLFWAGAATLVVGTLAHNFGLLGTAAEAAGNGIRSVTGTNIGGGRTGAVLGMPERPTSREAARNFAQAMENLPAGARTRLEAAGADPERRRQALNQSLEAADKEVQAAENRRLVADRAASAQSREERIVSQNIQGRAQVRLRELILERERERATVREGDAPVTFPGDRELQERAARDAAGRMAAVPGVMARVLATLRGEDPEVAGRTAGVLRAQQELDRRTQERERIQAAINAGGARFGGGGADNQGALLSLHNLLPKPQVFTDFAQYGEQLTLKSMDRAGELDAIREMQTTNAILRRVEMAIDIISKHSDPINLISLGYIPGNR